MVHWSGRNSGRDRGEIWTTRDEGGKLLQGPEMWWWYPRIIENSRSCYGPWNLRFAKPRVGHVLRTQHFRIIYIAGDVSLPLKIAGEISGQNWRGCQVNSVTDANTRTYETGPGELFEKFIIYFEYDVHKAPILKHCKFWWDVNEILDFSDWHLK